MLEIDIPGGTDVKTAINLLINQASKDNIELFGEFNGIKIIANQNSNFEELNKKYYLDFKNRQEEYQKIDKFKEDKIKQDTQNLIDQNLLNQYTNEFLKNSQDLFSTAKFLYNIQPFTDNISLNVNRVEILKKLNELGFKTNINLNLSNYNVNEGLEYLIGQAIEGLMTGAIHGVYQNFYKKLVIV